MSEWTKVSGMIVVECPTFTKSETAYVVDTVVKHLPQINEVNKGPEIMINVLDRSNISTNFNQWMQKSDIGVYNGKRRKSFKIYHRQNMAVITIFGDLRGKWYKEILKDTTQFVSRLSKRLHIKDINLTVEGGNKGEKYTFVNASWISQNYCGGKQDQWMRKYMHTYVDFNDAYYGR